MSSDADRLWDEIAPKYRKQKGFCPMTPDEAEAAFDEAPAIPLSKDYIQSVVDSVTAGETPSWDPPDAGWKADAETEQVEEDMLAMYREEGEASAETDVAEQELRERLLNDEADDDEDGLAGGTAAPGGGR